MIHRIKKALFLENGSFSELRGYYIHFLYEDLVKNGIPCTVIERAHLHKEKVLKEAMEADTIIFASTFLYTDQIKGLGELIKNIPSKLIIGQPSRTFSLEANFINIWGSEEIAKFAHHEIYEMVSLPEDTEPYLRIDLDKYVKAVQEKKEEEKKFYAGIRRTGRMVKIKGCSTGGKEWSMLKPGDEVYELDPSEIEPDIKRGVWVMGLTQPVKLLNSDGHDEWEYANPKAIDLAMEFASKTGNLQKTELINLIGNFIGRNAGRLLMKNDGELWIWCDQLCNLLGVPRRGHRHYFDARISEYGSRYKHFSEF